MSIESLRGVAALDGERLESLWADRDRLRAAYEYLLPYVHIDIRSQALAIYGELGLRDQQPKKPA